MIKNRPHPRFLQSVACRPSDWSRRAIHSKDSKDSCELVFIRGSESKFKNRKSKMSQIHPNPPAPQKMYSR